jgi:anti-anti-sigma factor
MSVEVVKTFCYQYPMLIVRGNCDFNSVMELSDIARHHFRVGKKKYFMDLSQLNTMDSLLFGFFISLHIQIKDTGEALFILNPSPGVMEVLKLSNAEGILNLRFMNDLSILDPENCVLETLA